MLPHDSPAVDGNGSRAPTGTTYHLRFKVYEMEYLGPVGEQVDKSSEYLCTSDNHRDKLGRYLGMY